MKHLFIILLMIFVLPSFANIDAENESPTCDESVLNASNGTANLEINWEPNVIPLRWYSGNTLLPVENNDDTCTYDGVLNRPTNPTREGYNFDGWRVRPTMDFSTLGTIGAFKRWAKTSNYCWYETGTWNNTRVTCNSDEHFKQLQPYEWIAQDNNTDELLYGMSKCSAKSGDAHSGTWPIGYKDDWTESNIANLDNASGIKRYCWCKVTGYRATEQNPINASLKELPWIFLASFAGDESNCEANCSKTCAYKGELLLQRSKMLTF